MPLIIGMLGEKGSGKDSFCSGLQHAAIEDGILVQRIGFADVLKEIAHKLYNIPMHILVGPKDVKERPQEDNPLCVFHGSYDWEKPSAAHLHRASGELLILRETFDECNSASVVDDVDLHLMESWETGARFLADSVFLSECCDFKPGYLFVLTPRQVLQKLGTEVGRNIHSATWVNYCFLRIQREYADAAVVVITDVRFPNEFNAITGRPYKGLVIGVNRPGETKTLGAKHDSETSIPAMFREANVIIQNDGSLEELHGQAAEYWNTLKAEHGFTP